MAFVLINDDHQHVGSFFINPYDISREVSNSMPSQKKLNEQFDKDARRSNITINSKPINTSELCRDFLRHHDDETSDAIVGLLTQSALADMFQFVHDKTFDVVSRLNYMIVSGNNKSNICFDVTIADTEIVILSNVRFMMKNEKSEIVGHIDVRYEFMFDDGALDDFSNVKYEIMCM
jgi:hypothetical protein